MKFEFATATRIVFGPGSVEEACSAATSLGRRAVIVSGHSDAQLESFIRKLQACNVTATLLPVSGEPTIAAILEGVAAAKRSDCDLVIGYGGGSALDGAKAIAAFINNEGDPLDYLEVVGRGQPLTRPCAPCICIPTTAGTGSEVTRNAVLASPAHGVKVSLRSPRMFPLLAVVDPLLTHSLPPAITASTGMDALTQLIEPFVSSRANPFTDALCRDGIRRVALWLRTAFSSGDNAEARENMALASLFGGLALANAGLGAVHGLAAPLGGSSPIPHGVACARLLPFAMHATIKALNSRRDSSALARYDEVARLVTGGGSARAQDGVEWVRSLCADLAIPSLSDYGLTDADLPAIAEKGLQSSSMKGNPVPLTGDELVEILRQAL